MSTPPTKKTAKARAVGDNRPERGRNAQHPVKGVDDMVQDRQDSATELRAFEHKWLGYCIDEIIIEEIRDLFDEVRADEAGQFIGTLRMWEARAEELQATIARLESERDEARDTAVRLRIEKDQAKLLIESWKQRAERLERERDEAYTCFNAIPLAEVREMLADMGKRVNRDITIIPRGQALWRIADEILRDHGYGKDETP